jgi:hypothetical protein
LIKIIYVFFKIKALSNTLQSHLKTCADTASSNQNGLVIRIKEVGTYDFSLSEQKVSDQTDQQKDDKCRADYFQFKIEKLK